MIPIKLAILLMLVSLLLPSCVASSKDVVTYEDNGMAFEYPEAWDINESWSGVTLHDENASAIQSITMHREGCYDLGQHPILLDWLLKSYGRTLWGTPQGEPVTGYFEIKEGPYSYASQIYTDPSQLLSCEIRGYYERNVTVTFVGTLLDTDSPGLAEYTQQLANTMNSFRLI